MTLGCANSTSKDNFESGEIFDFIYENDSNEDGDSYDIIEEKPKRSLYNSFKLLRSQVNTKEQQEVAYGDTTEPQTQYEKVDMDSLHFARKIANLFKIFDSFTVRSRPNFFIG